MGTEIIKECPLCGSESKQYQEGLESLFVECPTCGRFQLSGPFHNDNSFPKDYDKLASYLFYNGKHNAPIKDSRFFNFIGSKEDFDKVYSKYPWCYHVTKDIIENWYPKTFSEKVDYFLLGLAHRANFLSEIILFTSEQLHSACFALRKVDGPMRNFPNIVNDQVDFFLDYLVNQDFIEAGDCRCTLLPKGLERIDCLQKNSDQNTKNVFVAMSFAPEMKDVREAIKLAIIECGYIPRIMDEIEHNHQIVPEMLYEIRESRFIIAELTGHNNGAYFEAGYALGYGKEVIQICQKSKFGEDGHFDVKQINTVLWNTTEELKEKIVSRIKATISK